MQKDYEGGQGPPKKAFRKRYSRQDFYLPGVPTGVKIPDSSEASLEKGLRYFKRQLKDAGTIMDLKSRREYVKPTTKRRKLKKDAIRKQQYHDKITKKYWDNFTWIVPGNYSGPKSP